jgi:hypothetical protein
MSDGKLSIMSDENISNITDEVLKLAESTINFCNQYKGFEKLSALKCAETIKEKITELKSSGKVDGVNLYEHVVRLYHAIDQDRNGSYDVSSQFRSIVEDVSGLMCELTCFMQEDMNFMQNRVYLYHIVAARSRLNVDKPLTNNDRHLFDMALCDAERILLKEMKPVMCDNNSKFESNCFN